MRVIKFSAVWCSGCLVMEPRWEEIEKEHPWLETIKYDYDNDIKEVRQWDISDILPTFIFIDKNNLEITRVSGERKKDTLIQLIQEHKDK